MILQFFGAAGTVTGSNYLLSDGRGYGIVIDMGMFQGNEELEALNHQPLGFDAREVHTVFLTHAHLDHVGRMPMIMKNGFSGKIYMTRATKEIAEIVLRDAAKIMQHDEEKPILYTEEDVFDLLNSAEVVSYGEEIDLGNIKATFRDAGHILGSASIEMQLAEINKKIVFSGDLGNSPEDLVRPTEYIESGDYVLLESTYGDRNHPTDNPIETITKEINTVEEKGGALLIPSFSVERTQALLHIINHLKKNGRIKMETPVYMDSPMGQKVTEIYRQFPDLFNSEIVNDMKDGDPFSFPGLHVIKDYKSSQKIRQNNKAKIIMAGSGMMNGGRILEHAAHFLPMNTTRLLIVGFQAEDTIGRQIEEGAKVVNIYGEDIAVKANVTAVHSMSAHADQEGLLKWIKQIKGVQKVFLVHGEDGPRSVLKEEINKLGIGEIYMPRLEEYSEI